MVLRFVVDCAIVQYDEYVIPEVTRARVTEALAQFDRELRPSSAWQGWEQREAPITWVIAHEGQAYPVRQVWQSATGAPASEVGFLRGAVPALNELGFATVSLEAWRARAAPSVWWVNQGASYDYESTGGFLWAPPGNKRGADRKAYARIHDLRIDDVVVHYAGRAIRAIGRVTSGAVTVPVTRTKDRKAKGGWRVSVEYVELGERAVASGRVTALFHGLEIAEGPFQTNRKVKNGYLWRFSAEALSRLHDEVGAPWPVWAGGAPLPLPPEIEPVVVSKADAVFDLAAATQALIHDIAASGFVYEPWQIAAFVTALRTKPFVILAGVSGTGKSRLPRLVAQATGGVDMAIPVRPDWNDSQDILGELDLQRRFRPGPLLVAAERATRDTQRLHVCVIDEMNLARVEHYLAEVLSRIEESPPGPLVTHVLSADDAAWGAISLPPNFAIVGTVNMDESTQGFSRKVLDRAFAIELTDIDLRNWGAAAGRALGAAWPISAWTARPGRLASRGTGGDRQAIQRIVDVLVEANAILATSHFQVGYRTRDEVVGFVLNAGDIANSFVASDGAPVSPLDLALMMKLLPRIAGDDGPVRQVVLGLLGFATTGRPCRDEQQADDLVAPWRTAGRRGALDRARFPRTAARLCLMWDRLVTGVSASFWL